MNKPMLLLLFCLLGISGIYGSSRLQFRNIGFKEGLKNMNISGITQDKPGYIWVGESGLRMVKQKLPDLIVSDIMMPKMNGFELTKAIKEDKELCHIPVILLTAKTEIESQIEGMHSGSIFYVVKPFNIDFLFAAIDSQLKNRKRLYEIFFNGQMPQPDKAEINQLDFQFLTRLTQFLEKELSNFGSPSYFSTVFRQEQGVSPREFLSQIKDKKVPEI